MIEMTNAGRRRSVYKSNLIKDIVGLRARRSVLLVSLIWLCAVMAAAAVSILTGPAKMAVLPFAVIALIPAALGIVLYPVMDREWAQISVMFAWIGLAVTATFAIAFVPMAFLFLCAPAAAALFKREMVVEAIVLSALAAGGVFYLSRMGYSPEIGLPDAVKEWGRVTAPAATLVFMIGSMFAAANSRADYAAQQTISNLDTAPQPDENDVLDAYPGAAFRTDDEGHIVYASPTAKFVMGSTSEELQGQSLAYALVKNERSNEAVNSAIDAALHSGSSQTAKVMAILIKDGAPETSCLQLNITPTPSDGAFVFASDITLEQNHIDALERQQGSARKEAHNKSLFFAGVSHELRTPLNAIIGFSDMMRSRLFGPLPGKYGEYADLIHDSGQHMLDLIGDVLDISKIEAGKYDLTYDQFDLADVVRSSLKMINPSADAAQVLLQPEIKDDVPIMLSADRRAVRQILLNLLSNAIKFTPKGGQITVLAERGEEEERGHVILSVSDTGEGMSASELKTVLEPYVQTSSASMTDHRGSGLGLTLVQSLVDMHGGALNIESQPKMGTHVRITLPVDQAEQA